jgi:hypothetical protein
MPPKQQQKPSSSKVKDDKTFGLKNVGLPLTFTYLIWPDWYGNVEK